MTKEEQENINVWPAITQLFNEGKIYAICDICRHRLGESEIQNKQCGFCPKANKDDSIRFYPTEVPENESN